MGGEDAASSTPKRRAVSAGAPDVASRLVGVAASSPTSVRANDFARQWEDIAPDALAAVDRVGRSGWLILGEEVDSFERELADWWGVSHAVGVASGLDALEIALRSAGVVPGTRVITTPLTAFATTLAIVRAGAEPVWCDVDESGGLDLGLVEAALLADDSIRALLPVHLYGHPLDPTELRRLADEHDLILIEDCAQSLGASRDRRPTGTAGMAAGTSLYPTKNLGALGDGGVLLTDDEAVAERARRIRDYGQSDRYRHVELGLNSRLDALHAAILRSAMLPRLDRWLQRRAEIAERYTAALAGTSLRPILPRAGASAHHLYPVEACDGVDPHSIASRLAEHGIVVGRHYPIVCPDQPAARDLGVRIGELSAARRIAARELSLPLHPYLQDDEVELVTHTCREVCG
jgi:dTDP-4-amino-4,6-dideoxygalactose transaminase